ncbi:Uncharacterised protein [Moraxella lacunata]|uniref:Uncharacterized protein n=1 Tax=Moraxella lacunata TaxID=477 RepID=A0A1V4GW29_MORLA|nr:hypothetical protein [Moraxella lacunata]OPH36834.1 hypothetical protein B5J94_06565 [Moraxella lacunata]STY99169.1 Uncharacterised protein [Moraxella lacunata]
MDLHSPHDWLHVAKKFNTLWHEYDDQALDELYHDQPDELAYHTAQKTLLRNQKTHAQITALRLAYDHAKTYQTPCELVLSVDKAESQQVGELIYSLYPHNDNPTHFNHIPERVLKEHLTHTELVFFGIPV